MGLCWRKPSTTQERRGCSLMVADFVCEFGWLRGPNGESARVTMFPGGDKDGWFTNDRVILQLEDAVKIVNEHFPQFTHIFVYDNAPSHTKRSLSSLSAYGMPKGPLLDWPYYKDKDDKRVFEFYDPNEPNRFKGMSWILRERGLGHLADLNAVCTKGCEPGKTDCCCRRVMMNQPDFNNRESGLQEAARELGTEVVFLPKYHCELSMIEQVWGYAKRDYRDNPPNSSSKKLKENALKALESPPILSMRKFAARSQRFADGYDHGMDGSQAAAWLQRYSTSPRDPAHIPTSTEPLIRGNVGLNLAPVVSHPSAEQAIIPNQYIVVLKPEATLDDLNAHAMAVQSHDETSPLTDGPGLTHIFDGVLKGVAGKFSDATLDKIRATRFLRMMLTRTYGVAKKAQVHAVKVLGSNGSGSMADVTSHKGSVANMSLGGGKSPALDRAVNAAVRNGMHFAVAAGNDNKDACNYSPAAAELAVTVGASTSRPCVDIFAPGLNILSTWIGSKTATNTISGTSMASPHTAGLLAYYLSLHGTATFNPVLSDASKALVSNWNPTAAKNMPVSVSVESFYNEDGTLDVTQFGGITPAQLKQALIDLGERGKLSALPENTVNILIFNNATDAKGHLGTKLIPVV
ncbi:Retrovirus-related Pol polyprotein from transposon TNT 1-94 [Rhizoctonia solani]|uniref:Retrovirus-related Pol polyprotein from transposon TNT 1-94 n=1 Tax=Rhizoctonia solani TaxID=456999 RepID=A0A8H8P8C0_9AGAM|nr:Retrovirus-related Pol polyprotein from transposon TNT 1-94 [Rhizoctonia solani]QRW25382.1 Retrovirus-related Pol polyprotein from transposon TNT 1-94 [Rhizoctonia solani]